MTSLTSPSPLTRCTAWRQERRPREPESFLVKLFEAPSPNGRRVRVFLAEKGIEIEGVSVDLRSAENLGDEFRAMNWSGSSPGIG